MNSERFNVVLRSSTVNRISTINTPVTIDNLYTDNHLCVKNFRWIRFGVDVNGYGTFEYTIHPCAYPISDQVNYVGRVIINIGVTGGEYHGYYSVNWNTGVVQFNIYNVNGNASLSSISHHYITWCLNAMDYNS